VAGAVASRGHSPRLWVKKRKTNNTMLQPTLHKSVPFGTKVIVPKTYTGKDNVTGEVAGYFLNACNI
jgi:hypothetical protein